MELGDEIYMLGLEAPSYTEKYQEGYRDAIQDVLDLIKKRQVSK